MHLALPSPSQGETRLQGGGGGDAGRLIVAARCTQVPPDSQLTSNEPSNGVEGASRVVVKVTTMVRVSPRSRD